MAKTRNTPRTTTPRFFINSSCRERSAWTFDAKQLGRVNKGRCAPQFFLRVLHLKREIRVNRDAVLSVPDGVADQRKRTLSMSVMGILQQLPSPESLVDFVFATFGSESV